MKINGWPCGSFGLSRTVPQLLLGSVGNAAKLWDLRCGKCGRTFAGHTDVVRHAEISPYGRVAITASDDHTLKVWDVSSGAELTSLRGHSAGVTRCSVGWPLVVSSSYDGTLRTWLLPP